MVEDLHYKHIFDSLLSATIVLDGNLRLRFLNLSGEMLLGLSSKQVVGKDVSSCFVDSQNSPNSFLSALTENRQITVRQATWKLHNQSEVTVDYSVTPNPEMDIIVIEAHALDRLLRISREESKLSTQFTSRNLIRSVAHEIKNPLGGIRGAAQLLQRELVTKSLEEYEEYTHIIIEETDRLRNLVDRMLGPHRIPERGMFNIHEVLEHVMSVVNAETQHTIPIRRDYDPSIPDIPGDKELLIQATLNIARNAVQALKENESPKGDRSIMFRTRIQRRYTIGRLQHALVARLAIIDNGPGIPPELLPNIFFPMITGRPEGTGLGLAIAQNLVNQHKGNIECRSQPGRTEFSIYLPLEENYAEE